MTLHFVPSLIDGKWPAPGTLTTEQVTIIGPLGELWPEWVDTSDAQQGRILVRVPTPPSGDAFWRFDASLTVRLKNVPDIDPFFDSALLNVLPSGQKAQDGGVPKPFVSVPDGKPAIDYLNRDYASFRQMMLGWMAVWDPAWQERNAADLGVTIVEVLAYAGDQLSYYQDAIGTEQYLETARMRTSIRRHLRLIDYRLLDGCNARTWMHIKVERDCELRAGTVFYADYGGAGEPCFETGSLDLWDLEQRHVFESMYDKHLWEEQNQIEIYSWGADVYQLDAGATRATLRGHIKSLQRGSVLVFEDGSQNLPAKEAHAVRLSSDPLLGTDRLFGVPITEVAWHDDDALPQAMQVAASNVRNGHLTVALGNILLADCGLTIRDVDLPPCVDPSTYRPLLPTTGITLAQPFSPVDATLRSAAMALVQDLAKALTAVSVQSKVRHEIQPATQWTVRLDLLTSGPDSSDFVVEIETDGSARLRFGDGKLGMSPPPGSTMKCSYRIGNGLSGNVSSNLVTGIWPRNEEHKWVREVRNPIAARGGTEPEDMFLARLLAPHDLVSQERCVTDLDYEEYAKSLPGVQNVYVDRFWRGNRSIIRVIAQRAGEKIEDSEFLNSVAEALAPRRILGNIVEVDAPRYLPMAVSLEVKAFDPISIADVRRRLFQAFSSEGDGFFSRDNFTFGGVLFASEVIQRAMLPGVASAVLTNFGILGRNPENAVVLQPAPSEILRLDSKDGQSNFGILTIEVSG